MKSILSSQIAALLQQHLGNQLQTLYHWSGKTAGIDWLLLTSEETSLAQLRQIWQKVRPLDASWQMVIATPSTWQNHLRLDSAWGYRLTQSGQWCAGKPLPLLPTPNPQQNLAYLANQLLELSVAVTQPTTPIASQMPALAHELGLDHNLPLSQLFASLQAYWQSQTTTTTNLSDRPDAPPLLPELQAIYEQGNRLIFVLPDCLPARWAEIPWQTIYHTLPLSYSGLHLTTTSQFRLLNQHHLPIYHLLRHYTLAWGEDCLADLPIAAADYWLHAARFPSQLALVELPIHYLNAADDQLPQLIHDFQNKLQNVQLRHELLSRLLKTPRTAPPEPLPPRTASPDRRIAGIFQHLHWWTNHYTKLLTTT